MSPTAAGAVKRPVSSNNLAAAVAPPAPPILASVSKDHPPKPAAQYAEHAVAPQTAGSVTGSPSVSSGGDYSHYNSKLTIDNFDLLKVRELEFIFDSFPMKIIF